jgi:hypothetical protein
MTHPRKGQIPRRREGRLDTKVKQLIANGPAQSRGPGERYDTLTDNPCLEASGSLAAMFAMNLDRLTPAQRAMVDV